MNYVEAQNKFTSVITEQFSLIEEIKTNGGYDESLIRLNSGFIGVLKSYSKSISMTTIYSFLDSFITFIFQGVVLIYGGLLVADGKISIGTYTIINIYYAQITNSIRYYLTLGQSYQSVLVSLKRLNHFIELDCEQNGSQILDKVNHINVENLFFYYNEHKQHLISNISMSFKKGELCCIIGNNGSGKTTFINILLGIIQNNVIGDIYFNNIDIKNIDMTFAKKDLISVVKQNPRFPNLVLSEVLKSDDINSLIIEYGLEYLYKNEQFDLSCSLDKKVVELSGGERQKIALLNALIKGPSLLILDEPTSAMDKKSKDILVEFLQRYKRHHIIICITHDNQLVQCADKTLDLNSLQETTR